MVKKLFWGIIFFSINFLNAQSLPDWENPTVNGINKEKPHAFGFLASERRGGQARHRRVPAQRTAETRLPDSLHAAPGRPASLAGFRAPGFLPAEYVSGPGDGEPAAAGQTDELSRPHPDIQEPSPQLP